MCDMEDQNRIFPIYELSGTYFEMGRQYGEQCKEQIKHMVQWWIDVILGLWPNIEPQVMIKQSSRFIEPIKAYAPELFEQMEGIAEGSGLPLNEILFLNGACEFDAGGSALMGCTSFAAAGEATKDGKTILGQNLDWNPGSDVVVLRLKPKNGPKMLALTLAGSLGMVGISEAGVSVFINLLLRSNVAFGVPFNVITANVLRQKNLVDCIRAVSQAKRAIAFNYMLADKEGSIIDVETSIENCGFLLPNNDILTHANHYETVWLQEGDLNQYSSFPDSYLRSYRLAQLMEKKRGALCVDEMKSMLQDHRDWPDSICRHCDMTGPVAERFESSISMIAVPEDGKIFATSNPCVNQYSLYTI